MIQGDLPGDSTNGVKVQITSTTGDTSGNAKTQVVGAGGQVQPAGDAATRPQFVELSDGAAAVGTAGNPLRNSPTTALAVLPATADAGQNLSLGDTASHQFASAACTIGCILSAPLSNTAPVYFARATGVTSGATGKGLELQPGERSPLLPCANVNEYWAITGTATQNVHAVAI